MKAWLAIAALCVLGVWAHHELAAFMVERRISGVLLAAGAGARPADAGLALAFVVLRVVGLPLLMGAAAGAVVSGGSALFSRRRSRSR